MTAHFLQPFGKIYFTLGNFPVTEGSLRTGLIKTTTVIGLVYLSRLTIRPGLGFPGRPGRIFAETLRCFERITAYRTRIDRKNFWPSLDRLLAAVYGAGDEIRPGPARTADPVEKNSPAVKTSIRGYLLGILFAALNWGVFVFTAA
jgi:hypothetical protein